MKHPWFDAPHAGKTVLLLSALLLTAHPARADEWLKYEADHLTVYSDCPPYRAKSLMRQFAAFQYAARTLLVPPSSAFPHTTLVCFNQQSDFEKYYQPLKLRHSTRVIWHGASSVGRNRLIATAWTSNIEERIHSMIKTEAGVLLHWYDDAPPKWMLYATENIFSKFSLSNDTIKFGGPNEDQRRNLAKSQWREWSVIVTDAKDELIEKEKVPTNTLQAQVWLLGDWMLFAEAPQGSSYMKMLHALRSDAPSIPAAFEKGLGLSSAELTEKLRQYFKKPTSSRTLAFDTGTFDASVRSSPATVQEMHIQYFHLNIAINQLSAALEELDKAIASGPDTTELKYARVIGAEKNGNPKEATAICRESIAAGSQDAFFYLNSALARLKNVNFVLNQENGTETTFIGGRDAPGAAARIAIEEILTAKRLDPAYPHNYRYLADAVSRLPAVTREDAEMLSPGVSIHPHGLYVRLTRGLTYQRAGAKAEAEADFNYLLEQHPESKQAEFIIKQREQQTEAKIQTGEQMQLEALFAQRKFTEARRIVADKLSAETNIVAMRALEKEIKRLDEIIAWEEVTSLTKEKRWAEVEKAAEKYIELFPKSPRVQVIKNRLRKAQEQLRL